MVPYPVQDQQGHADASHQRHHANQSIKKSVAASDSKGRPKGGKSKKRKESYAIYFYNVLKQVHPDTKAKRLFSQVAAPQEAMMDAMLIKHLSRLCR